MKRFDFECSWDGYIREAQDGDFVAYEEVEKLQARIDELEENAEKLQEKITSLEAKIECWRKIPE